MNELFGTIPIQISKLSNSVVLWLNALGVFLRTDMKRKKEGEMKFQACTLEIHKEMHPNFLLEKNLLQVSVTLPHQVSLFILLQAFHVDIPKHRHYYTTLLISKKSSNFFFC